MIEEEFWLLVPLIRMHSSSEMRSWTTSSAVPRYDDSNVSSPSRLASVEISVA
jgi:hypothetical protein